MSKASKARTIRLHSEMSVPTALRHVVVECARQLQKNVSAIIAHVDSAADDDMECVHQARVALRRLRSADKAFAALPAAPTWRSLQHEAGWLADLLGNLRDLQILNTKTLPLLGQAHPAIDFAPLHTELAQRVIRARVHLLKALYSKRFRAFASLLQQWQDSEPNAVRTRLPIFARRALTRRWRRVDALAVRWDRLDTAQRHTLRKRVKKLRYAIEFFSALYPPQAIDKYAKHLEKIQTALGKLNDVASAQLLIRPLLQRRRTAAAASAALGWLNCAEQTQLGTTATALARWRRCTPFWH